MRKVLICTGAGLSAASGLGVFRGNNGMWENYNLDEVCYLPNFMKNYIKTNEFYEARRKQHANAKPNTAHITLANAQKNLTHLNIVHITTNVDTLLEQAGCTNVIHLHGRLDEMIVHYNTPNQKIVPADSIDWQDPDLYPVKPNVVFFNELAPEYETLGDQIDSLQDGDVVIIIGSSEQVVNFSYAVRNEYRKQCKIIHVGPELPVFSNADLHINENAENIDFEEFIKQL